MEIKQRLIPDTYDIKVFGYEHKLCPLVFYHSYKVSFKQLIA